MTFVLFILFSLYGQITAGSPKAKSSNPHLFQLWKLVFTFCQAGHRTLCLHTMESRDDDPGRVEQSLTGTIVPQINGFCCHSSTGKEKLPRGNDNCAGTTSKIVL